MNSLPTIWDILRPCAAVCFGGLLAIAPASCAATMRGDPANVPAEIEENWSNQFRQPTPKGQSTGIDQRAREIERNLGVQ